MSIKNTYGLIVFILIFMAGCAGTPQPSGGFKIHPGDEQKVIIQKIKDNMGGYDIIDCRALFVFDPKDDDKTIEVGDPRCRPFVQQTRSDFVEIYEVTGIRTIVGPDGQAFGFITWAFQRVYVNAELVDAKTMRISLSRKPGGAPGR
jgi:nitrate reductase NapE component